MGHYSQNNHNQNHNGHYSSNGHNGHPTQNQMHQQHPQHPQNQNQHNPRSPQQNQNQDNNKLQELGDQTWKALQKLHGQNSSGEDRNNADQFLSKYLPNQDLCWQIFMKFLTTDKLPHAVHFFAANMLRSKIQRNLHQVPQNFHIKLHDMIINTLINFNKKDNEYENVITQLSIGLALLSIQRTDWTDQVQKIINKLANNETLNILLNILQRLPEELDTFHIPVSPKIKHIAADNLRQHASLVLKLLHSLFGAVETNNLPNKIAIKLKVCFILFVFSARMCLCLYSYPCAQIIFFSFHFLQVFKCFAAWLDFMDDHFQEFMKDYAILTEVCFRSLDNDMLFDPACICISKVCFIKKKNY